MNCSEFERELEQLVETRGSALPAAASSHCSQCAACQQVWNDHRLLTAAVTLWKPVTVPASLAAGVLDQLRDLRPSEPAIRGTARSVSGQGRIAVAAAAVLLAVLGLGMMRWSGSIGDQLAQHQPNRPAAPLEVTSSMAAVLDDLRTEYRGLADETSATARDLAITMPSTVSVVPWVDANPLAGPTSSNDEPSASPHAVTALGNSIGTQISQAMDFLWTSVPDEVPRG